MYKSSSKTIYYKYFFVPIFIVGASFQIYNPWIANSGIYEINWSFLEVALFMWFSFWLFILMVKLRNIVAFEEGINIKTFNNQKHIQYKDIYWIYQFPLAYPALAIIKYHDENTNHRRKILFIPRAVSESFDIYKEREMVSYIKENAKAKSLNYKKTGLFTRWKTVVIIGMGVVIILLINILIG